MASDPRHSREAGKSASSSTKRFECTNCGACCTDKTIQLNLTSGDLLRICSFTKKSLSSLFNGFIGIHPFSDPQNPGVFDFEIGLTLPCRFRFDSKCSIYEARPLNCRLFPIWLIVKNIRLDKNPYPCLQNLKLSKKARQPYSRYEEIVGQILLQESSKLDQIMIDNNLNKSTDVTRLPDFEMIIKKSETIPDPGERNHFLKSCLMDLASKKIDKHLYSNLPRILDKALIKDRYVKELIALHNQRLSEAEDLLKI